MGVGPSVTHWDNFEGDFIRNVISDFNRGRPTSRSCTLSVSPRVRKERDGEG